MPTTFRHDVVAGLVATLNTYKSSNPTLLRAVYTARPAHIAETPCAYIGSRSEVIEHTSGLRNRNINGITAVILDVQPDNQQTADRMDVLVDALLDAFTAAPHMASANTVVTPTAVTDDEDDYGGVTYRLAVFSFGEAIISEGRN
jgi:hypothetical protein